MTDSKMPRLEEEVRRLRARVRELENAESERGAEEGRPSTQRELERQIRDRTVALEEANEELQNEIEVRKGTGENLKRRQEELQMILDSVPALIFYKDKKDRFIRINKYFVDALGLTEERVLGRTTRELFPDYSESYVRDDREIIETGRPKRNIVEPVRGDNGVLWLRTDKVPIRDRQGRIIGIMGFSIDITQNKENEEKLRADRDEFQRLSRELSRAEESERRRIAMELHDRIGPTLALAKIKLGDLRGSIKDAVAGSAMVEVQGLIERIISDTRKLTVQLSPPILYEFGLEAAVEWLLEQKKESYGLDFNFYDDQAPKPLDENVQAFLYRGVRELLLNVIKHSGVKKVRVRIWRKRGEILIDIEDEGVSFELASHDTTAKTGGGFGLYSLHERMAHIGGSLEIRTAPGRGTRATLRAPLIEQDEDE